VNAWAPPVLGSVPTKLVTTNMMFCWGWATWSNKWNEFALQEDFQAKNINSLAGLRGSFMGLAGFRRQLRLNDKGQIKTWAVYWYWYLFTNHKKCIGPNKSLVRNTGNDGTGENCSNVDVQNNLRSIFDGQIQFESPMIKQSSFANKRYLIHLYIWLAVRDVFMLINKLKKIKNKR
jgi:hypothetical protein